MSNFDWCKMAFDRGWTDADKLRVWVRVGEITSEEYKIITGQDYTS